MKLLTKTLAAALVISAGVAYAEAERTDPNAIEREELMEKIGASTKVLGDMAGDKAPFDAAAAEAAKAVLIAAAGEIPAKFETPGAADPVSEAKPEIWTGWDDFVAKSKVLATAVGAIDVASLDGVKAGMGAIGGACKDCHTTYRIQK